MANKQDNLVNGGEESNVQSVAFKCDQCSKTYKNKKSLTRHIQAEHSGQKFPCGTCGKEFTYVGHRTRHEKSCQPGVKYFHCDICGKRCATEGGLQRHQEIHQGPSKPPAASKPSTKKAGVKRKTKEPGPSVVSKKPRMSPVEFRCRRCPESFNNRHDLYVHGMRHHYQVGGGLQPVPWGQNPAPWDNEDGTVDENLQEVYETNSPLILQVDRPGPIQSTYNFPVDNNISVAQLNKFALEVYDREQQAFRFNLSFGVILQHRETGEYRYFTPYTNSMVFDSPVYMSRRTDLRRVYLRLRRMDILTELLRQRPDTKWIPVLITNMVFTVYSTQYSLGIGALPDYLRNHNAIEPLEVNKRTGEVYDDRQCAFRCYARHKGFDIKSLEGAANRYFQQWKCSKQCQEPFSGLSMQEFPEFEEEFNINLEVYSLEENGYARSIYRSKRRYEDTMYLNLYEHHLSYITNFDGYAKKFQCKNCDRHFDHIGNLHKHQKICTNKTKYVFPGGFFKSNQTIFEKLKEQDILVPEEQQLFSWFIVYDFEAMLKKMSESSTENLKWTQKHVPISVSVCSNVPGFKQPHCIVEQDIDKLVENMVNYMKVIGNSVTELAEQKWGWVLKALDQKVNKYLDYGEGAESDVGGECDEDSEGEEEKEDDTLGDKQTKKALQKLYGRMSGYMNQVPILGFNSARYDLNLIKQHVARHLCMHDPEQHNFVVKKNNAYTCISTPDLKFLDIMQFLGPSTSYANFLKAYGVQEQKGFFPYEWLDDISKLNHVELPPHNAFYSSLKSKNITAEEYQYCQEQWRERNMKTFQDFLVWYNNLDVGPFVTAVIRFQNFYFERGIDVLKTAISVPGIARQLLFKTAQEAGANFALFDRYNEDLYHTFKNNIVGGPSIIFTRHHQAGKTRIRGEKLCQKIVGFDANALYLWALGEKMPVGPFIRRRSDNNFRPEIRDKYMAAYYWMDWLNISGEAEINHKLNCGVEKRVGMYPVDGWDASTNTIYQFHGCYFHGHECALTRDIKDKKWWQQRKSKYEKTINTSKYLRQQGYNIEEMWECQFKEYCRAHPKIYDFINESRPGFFRKHRGIVTENDILRGVLVDQLFGAVEVDIEVPNQWPSHFRHPTLTPYQYFQEMSPLFCTNDVPFEAIGEHMQNHVKDHNLPKASRRLLVGGMKARQILIATPLLKWYLEHGMVVTKVYQVVEYKAQACFSKFVQQVSVARREGDKDKNTAIIADTMKLIGCSGYGSLIMDKTKHRDIKYIDSETRACLLINDPRFRNMECLDMEQQYYEAEMAKRKIKLDLPIQLGYFILQYAKLRMLEFYYDFMDVYVDRSNFEYCEMDTDSAYMAISASSIDDVIKPKMKEKYMKGVKGFCGSAEVEADIEYHWFPRTCCRDHASFDKRTPGLFKMEYEGEEMIGLCSKTYIVRNGEDYKFSSKGVNKTSIPDPMATFRNVLSTGNAESGINRGFRARNNTIYTYTQEKRGFSYFYCKRKVGDDGIHTSPLDITLCPVPSTEEEKEDEGEQEVIDALAELLGEQ